MKNNLGNETKKEQLVRGRWSGFAPEQPSIFHTCPKCKSDNITSDNSEMHKSVGAIGDYIICENCDCEWYEVYNFSHIEIEILGGKNDERS